MDCNNFFVSCERLFRPDLWGKPVAVLSSNDGCIVARSQEVKDMGIQMGIPYFKVKDLCKEEGVTLFSSNFKLYRDVSARVMCALQEEFDTIDIYSVDEAFFAADSPLSEAEIGEIRARIIRKTGIPVSFGVARTKTIAKAASEYAKKGSGVCILDKKTWEERTQEVPCGSIWGIGRQTTAKLEKTGIRTVADFLQRDVAYYREHFGVVGERMYHELSGTCVHTVEKDGHQALEQSISSTRSFKETTHDRSVLESALAYHVTHVGEKLREQGHAASLIHIIAAPSRFSDFALRKSSASVELQVSTADTRVLLRESLKLLATLYDSEIPYKKAGVTLAGILPQALVSTALFEDETDTRSLGVYRVLDTLNKKFGKGTVRPGVVTKTEKWGPRAELRSKEYTTSWQDIVSVKAT